MKKSHGQRKCLTRKENCHGKKKENRKKISFKETRKKLKQ